MLATCSCWADVSVSGASSGTTISMAMENDVYDTGGIKHDEAMIAGDFGSLTFNVGNNLYISDTYTETNDGEVGAETHAGGSFRYRTPSIDGLNISLGYAANDDDASATSVGAGYVIDLGDARSIGFAIGFTDSDDGDTTFMPEGTSLALSYAMEDLTLSAKTTEGNNFDRATGGEIEYKMSPDLSVGASHIEVKNVGEYSRDTDTTSMNVTYAIASGVKVYIAYNRTNGYSDADTANTSDNSITMRMSF